MMGHRTGLLFSGILSMVFARVAIPSAFDGSPIQERGARELVERPLVRAPEQSEQDNLLVNAVAKNRNMAPGYPALSSPSATRTIPQTIATASLHGTQKEYSNGRQNDLQGSLDGTVLTTTAKFLPQYNLMRLDGQEIDPEAARLLFYRVQTTARSNRPEDVLGCYEVVKEKLKTLNCLDALKGSLDPASSRTYYVELAGLPSSPP